MDQPPMDPQALAQMLLAQPVPLPRPDPRGSVVSYAPVEQVAPTQPAPGISEHALAGLRAVFEGSRYREKMAPYRDDTGLYNRNR